MSTFDKKHVLSFYSIQSRPYTWIYVDRGVPPSTYLCVLVAVLSIRKYGILHSCLWECSLVICNLNTIETNAETCHDFHRINMYPFLGYWQIKVEPECTSICTLYTYTIFIDAKQFVCIESGFKCWMLCFVPVFASCGCPLWRAFGLFITTNALYQIFIRGLILHQPAKGQQGEKKIG